MNSHSIGITVGRCRVRLISALTATVGVSLVLSGCIGPIVGILIGGESETVDVPAEYVLPAGRMAILIDSRSEVASLSGARPLLAMELAGEIRRYGMAPEIVGFEEVSNFETYTANFNQLSVAEVGKGVGAKQVLYVEVLDFSLGTLVDKPAGRGMIRVRAKIFDVEANRRVWPEQETLGREVALETGFREPEGADYRHVFTEELCKKAAAETVKYFRIRAEARRATTY